MILCSECYDELGIEHFTDIQCQATCERCKRIYLGYVTEAQAPPRRRKDKMDDKELTVEQVEKYAFTAMRAFWKVAADELSKSTDSQKGTSDDNSGGVYANGLD